MAALTTLVPDVRSEIPDIPSFVAERQLLRAARVFCQETRAWRVNIEVSVTQTVAKVVLTSLLPTGTELVDIVSLKNTAGGEPVVPRTFSWLDENLTDWRSDTGPNANYYVLDGNNTMRLVPTPSATTAYLYDARIAVKPLRTAAALDDVLLNKYDEYLIHGALGYLYFMPRKPWTDLNQGQYHQAAFMNSWAQARAEAADEFQVGVPRKVKYGGL